MSTPPLVIHHSADYDGLFCREIARRFIPDATLIGWNFGDPPVVPRDNPSTVYVMDLPCDKPLGISADRLCDCRNLVWIDHHKSSINSHPTTIPGYRIDGVSACRLAWQYFALFHPSAGSFSLPTKEQFLDRHVSEPLAVRLAGEYDVWDLRDADTVAFQFGLDSQTTIPWDSLLRATLEAYDLAASVALSGKMAMRCYAKRDADIMRERSFLVMFDGLKFLALNTARCNSITFQSRDVPETGHDALMGFYWNGNTWTVSLYHAKGKEDIDLSLIAVNHGGGGHRGACGFQSNTLPFLW